MSRADKERQDRRQRMLAREQGQPWEPGDTLPGTDTGAGVRVPKKVRRDGAPQAPEIPKPNPTVGNLKPLSPLLRRRKRRRQLLIAGVLLAAVLFVAAVTGAFASAAGLLADAFDSAVLYLNRANAGWPAGTGITDPTAAEPLAGGLVLMDKEDVAVYSAYGAHIRTLQPGYGRPALAVGSTHFALYNRAGTELSMESRTKTLYTHSFEGGLLQCAVSDNGSLAAVTQGERYAAVLEVLGPNEDPVITYSLAQEDGVPVALAFAADNRRLAAGAVTAQNGQLQSFVYSLDTTQETLGVRYAADAGSLVLQVRWLSGSRILAVFDTYTALIEVATGAELARYSYGGAVLQQAVHGGQQTALLLAVRSGSTLVTLNADLQVLANIPAAPTAAAAAARTGVYLLDGDTVYCYGYDGAAQWQQTFDTHPQLVVDAEEPLLVASGTIRPLTAPPGTLESGQDEESSQSQESSQGEESGQSEQSGT